MSQLDPTTTTAGDICAAALKECGAIGVGQVPLAEDLADALTRLTWMLQQWERKRWLVWHLVDLSVVCNGGISYTIGPGGQINTSTAGNPFNSQFNFQFGPNAPSVRPARIESAFIRQLSVGPANLIDYPLTLLQSREDYNQIALKGLMSFPTYLFYDTSWPLGNLFPWPVPNANIYELHVSVIAQLPVSFANSSVGFNLPYECYSAMMYNLALRLRPKYGIGAFPGDMLPAFAKDSLNVLRGANTQIGQLEMPGGLARNGLYNVFSDRFY